MARFVQIEKRGLVIGDRTAGGVMEAIHYQHQINLGPYNAVFYGASVATGNVLMTDGKSLEHVGVTPDERMVPTAADLLEGRDPVLAHAVEILGGRMSPREAGALFPYQWPRL